MQRKIHRTASHCLVWTVLASISVVPAVGQGVGPLDLRIPDEQVPPGGVIQVKLELTEPKPISTGGGHFTFAGIDELLGVAVQSPHNDAAAVVVRRPSGFNVRLVSSSATLGLQDDYPILTMTLHVPAGLPIGSRRSLSLAGAQFLDPSGNSYPIDFEPGEAVIARVPAISAVSPGSATVPAGFPITVEGVGFETGMRVDLKDADLASVQVLSPTLIRLITARPTVMHGKEIEIRTRSDARSSYFSYQRATPVAPSAHPLFAAAEPAFPNRDTTAAVVRFQPGRPAIVNGIAIQNLSSVTAATVLELIDGPLPVRQASVTLPPNTRVVRTLQEMFGIDCGGPDCTVDLRSNVPLQFLGIVADTTQMAASPLLPSSPGGGGTIALVTSTNAASFRPGDPLVLRATYDPGATAVVADAYVVLQLPDGELRSLTSVGLVAGLTPYARNVPVVAMTQELLRLAIPPSTPTGAYRWLSALAVPGTLSLLTPIASTSMTISP